VSAEQTSSDPGVVVAPPRQRRFQLTGTQLTIMVVVALLTIVPTTAVAVAAGSVIVVDAKTGASAQVTNGGQLNVRGIVSSSDIVPTGSWSDYHLFSAQDAEIVATHLVAQAPSGKSLTVGELSAQGDSGTGPDVDLEARYVANTAACPSVPGLASAFLWRGAGQRPSDTAMNFSFPIPLTVAAPKVDLRVCLFVRVSGFRNHATVSVVGAVGERN
jgi:hypothetical protein